MNVRFTDIKVSNKNLTVTPAFGQFCPKPTTGIRRQRSTRMGTTKPGTSPGTFPWKPGGYRMILKHFLCELSGKREIRISKEQTVPVTMINIKFRLHVELPK